ncbi:MAG: TVP38/TMEM64 family protein [Sphingomonadales bacterium]|nr:TVP38/TMEM64 family protein [Sphingomonadales bacterium]
MKELIKTILIIGAIFALTFIAVKLTGVLTVEQIKGWLALAKEASPVHVALIVIALLFIDLFIAVPTMTTTMLAGYFLGAVVGTTAALTGLMVAGISGYVISRYFGKRILNVLVKDKTKRGEMTTAFNKHGFVMIMLARAVPILPEVTACLAGITKMPFWKFILAWSISAVPYTIIAAYSGSISTLNDPKPAIFTAIGIWGILWLGWFLFRRAHKKSVKI